MKHFRAFYINGITGHEETMLIKEESKEKAEQVFFSTNNKIVADVLLNIVEVVYDQSNYSWVEVIEAKVNPFKLYDYVALDGIGVGKIEKVYNNGDIVIDICEVKYYRNINSDTDIQLTNVNEYLTFLKSMMKQLTEQSKSKRKQASEYNKQTNGEATKRKGKVRFENGYIIPVENTLSAHHRNLLNDAKKVRELKDKIKKEIEFLRRWAV